MNWTLRYLICYAGVAGAQRLDTLRRTGWDALHACQAYLCASKEEWDMLGKNLVSKANRRLYMAVELFCAETGERRKLTGAEVLPLEGSAGTPARSESFLDRLHTEKAQLEERWLKLQDFVLTSPKFAELPEIQRSMLTTQSDLMRQYLEVLNRRLDLLAMPQSQEGSEPAGAHNPVEAGATPAPATIPQMPEGSQSGGADEAPVEPEGTLSVEEDKNSPEPPAIEGGADTPVRSPEPEAEKSLRAPLPEPKPAAKPKPPAKKAAKGKK